MAPGRGERARSRGTGTIYGECFVLKMMYTRLRVRAVPRPRLHPDPPHDPSRGVATLNYELSVNNNVVDAQSSSEAPGLAMATAARKAQMSPSAPANSTCSLMTGA